MKGIKALETAWAIMTVLIAALAAYKLAVLPFSRAWFYIIFPVITFLMYLRRRRDRIRSGENR